MNVPKLRFKEFNDEWSKDILKNIILFIVDNRGKNPDYYCKNGIPVIDNFMIQNNGYPNLKKTLRYIDENIYNNFIRKHIEYNDILITLVGNGIGNLSLAPKSKAVIIQNTLGLRPYPIFCKKFIYYLLLNNNETIKKLDRGMAQPSIRQDELLKLSVNFPNKKEQEKIGTFLSLLDKKIELQSKKIEALKLYKICISKKFFDNKNLTTTLLKNICNIKKGQQLNNEYLKVNGIYYMLNGGILPSGYTDNYNTFENTISISEGGNSCGYVNFNKEKFWSGGHCYTVEPININNEYLFQLLKYYEKAIMSLRVGSGLPNIQKKDLELFKVAIHTQDRQKDISKTLGKIDLKIVLESKKLSNLESLKKGLMQNMFV